MTISGRLGLTLSVFFDGGPKNSRHFWTKIKTTKGDRPHWVVTLSGLDFGPESGRFLFAALVPGADWSSGQR